jgi:hypothetical protein
MTKILIDEAVVRQALEALDEVSNSTGIDDYGHYVLSTEYDRTKVELATQVLNKALAEQPAQQEPVAWLFQHEETGLTECVDTQQVEWGFEKNNPRWQKVAPLYTTPPSPVQPLTDEQIEEIAARTLFPVNFARAIEAAHGITSGKTTEKGGAV